MSGLPSCASTEPSTYSTIEWTMLCGCTTTSIASAGAPNSQCASITSRPLFISVAESTEILRPMRQFGCAQACIRRDRAEFRGRGRETVRRMQSARMRRTPAASRSRAVRVRQALENRVVFAVDRQQYRPAFAHRLDEQRAGHHEGFFVREQHTLAGARGGKRRRKPRRTDDSGDHGVGLGQRGDRAKASLALQHTRR